jgi:protein-L-isoaspartate(D-aspartate) O-methyltransferase
MADFALQRKNMVESQVRTSDVTDRRIISALLAVPRENFVSQNARTIAYMDGHVRLSPASLRRPERILMAPRLFARLLDLAQVEPGHRVLIIGAGSGYSAAVLSQLCSHVVALESDPDLAAKAAQNLAALACENVEVVTGGLAEGWPQSAPYDVIIIEGAVAGVSATLLEQLKEGGVLVGILVGPKSGKASIWKRLGGKFDCREAFDASAAQLPGFEQRPQFRL